MVFLGCGCTNWYFVIFGSSDQRSVMEAKICQSEQFSFGSAIGEPVHDGILNGITPIQPLPCAINWVRIHLR